MKCKFFLIMCLVFVLSNSIFSVSMVYNFRIAQITKQPIFKHKLGRDHSIIALLFDQYRKKHTQVKQQFTGCLGAGIYNFNPYYFRTDFGFSHIHEKLQGKTTFSGTEADDVLFTVGRNFLINDHSVATISGLLGVPTHRIFRLQHVDVGYSQIGYGLQLDGSYEFPNTSDLFYGFRYIRFVPRKALDSAHECHLFTLGNIVDLLLAYKSSWHHHGLEVGYTNRYRFGAKIYPNLDDTIEKTNYIRSNFYLVYQYKFIVQGISHRLLCNISYGFDHRPKQYGNKTIITFWASWNIGF